MQVSTTLGKKNGKNRCEIFNKSYCVIVQDFEGCIFERILLTFLRLKLYNSLFTTVFYFGTAAIRCNRAVFATMFQQC